MHRLQFAREVRFVADHWALEPEDVRDMPLADYYRIRHLAEVEIANREAMVKAAMASRRSGGK